MDRPETELNEEELDEASGGIIIVGGNPVSSTKLQPNINFSQLNTQTLPLDKFKAKNLGGPDT